MGPNENLSPREFGTALRAARERAGLDIQSLCESTKLSRRMIEALESGQFSYLPAGVFPRLFLRQVVAILREEPEPWLRAFDSAFERFSNSTTLSQPIPVAAPKGLRVGPWVVGSALVAVALATVIIVERRQAGAPESSVPPTPEAALSALPRTPPTAAEPTPPPQPDPDPGTLVLRTVGRSCWVQARVAGEEPLSRLLAADASWELSTGGRAVDLVLGDAGAVQVDYLGQHHTTLGGDGEVARVHLGPQGITATPRP